VWRSGTSLLYALLNQHSKIALLYEGDLPLLWPLFRQEASGDWPEKWNFWNQAITRHRMDPAQVPRDAHDVRSACEIVYRNYASAKGADIWGEKSPTFHDHIPYLAKLFPAARFIIVWRSPLGIRSSMARAAGTSSWNARWSVRHRALMGCGELERGHRWLRAHDRRVHQLSYDELTSDPQGSLRSICNFLGVPYEPKIALLGDADRSAIYDEEHHALVKGGSIAKPKDDSGALRPEVTGKIQRYIAMWRRKYGADWPPVARSPVVDCKEPSFSERIWDRMLYAVLRSADLSVRMCLPLVSIGIWERYRHLKERRYKARNPVTNARL
jgi:hypothetical protein